MKIYAFKDPKNELSSSGGAFPAIIQAIADIERETPIVYGAAFDTNFSVSHIRTTCQEEYLKLYGSKYVRSKLCNCYENVVDDLNNRKLVVFSGTPCQISGLKNFVKTKGIDSTKLYLIDIVCHGTPQAKVWEDFKKWIEEKEKSKLIAFSFRYKQARWKSYPIMAQFDNGKKYVNNFKLRRYVELFYSDLILNESCYKCPFANTSRVSDITIGDYWGIRKTENEFPYKEEVSQILVNSEKGNLIINSFFDNNEYIICETNIEEAKKFQTTFNNPTSKPSKTYEFWSDYNNMEFENILKKYAGYNTRGMIKHCLKGFFGQTGLLLLIKDLLKI